MTSPETPPAPAATAVPAAAGSASARLLVLGAALLFSTGGSAIKLCALSSWQIAGLRSGVAAAVLWLCLPAWRPSRSLRPRELAVGAAYATTLVFFVTANTLTTAANAIFLQSTAPLYVLLCGPRWLGEPRRSGDLARVALIGAGLALIFAAAQPALRTAPDPRLGNWIAAASGASWALTLIGLRRLGAQPESSERDASGRAVLLGNLLALLACAPWLLPWSGGGALDWLTVLYLGSVQIGLAYLCLVRGVSRLGALEVSLLLCAEPVLSTLFAWLVHGERPAPLALVGSSLIALALVYQSIPGRVTPGKARR